MTAGAVPLIAVVVNPHPLAVSSVVAAGQPAVAPPGPAGRGLRRPIRARPAHGHHQRRAGASPSPLGAFLILDDRMTLGLLIIVVLINAGGASHLLLLAAGDGARARPSDALEYSQRRPGRHRGGTEHLAGPVVGTWLFAMSKAVPFFADAIALVLSCIPLVGFRSKAPKSEGASTSTWEGVRLLFADRRLRILLLLVGSLAGLQGMEAGVLVLLATTEWGVRRGRLRPLPRRRRGREPPGQPVGQPAGAAVRQRPDTDRRRHRLRRRLPDHGGRPGLAAGRPRLRRGLLCRRYRCRRGERPPPEGDPARGDGSGRRASGAASSGAPPPSAPCSPGAWPPSSASACPWCWQGSCSRRGLVLARPLLHSLREGTPVHVPAARRPAPPGAAPSLVSRRLAGFAAAIRNGIIGLRRRYAVRLARARKPARHGPISSFEQIPPIFRTVFADGAGPSRRGKGGGLNGGDGLPRRLGQAWNALSLAPIGEPRRRPQPMSGRSGRPPPPSTPSRVSWPSSRPPSA